jgi:hypothetical protein
LAIVTPGLAAPTGRPATQPTSRRQAATSGFLPVLAAWFYLLVAIAMLARLLVGWYATRRLIARARIVALPDSSCVYESAMVATPVTLGFVSCRIVLPAGWQAWPAGTRDAVLAHERAHARRRDPLVSFLAHLNCCAFWFHPMAWWLRRELATSAEHACDDAAVAAAADARSYAEVLLSMATVVQRRGRRLAWLGAGVDGAGRLDERIERVLADAPRSRLSRARRTAVVICSLAVIGGVAACQRTVAPLREDPALAAELAQRAADQVRVDAAVKLTPDEVATLETHVALTPRDIDARASLLIWYRRKGAGALGADATVAASRVHKLWLIEHAPLDGVTRNRAVFARDGWLADPAGHELAAALWRAHASAADATAAILGRAASFFESSNPREAERLLLRARTVDPENRETDVPGATWPGALGSFYGRMLTRGPDPSYAAEVRARLDATNDPRVLAAAGSMLTGVFVRSALQRTEPDFDVREAGQRYLDRAVAIDPSLEIARSARTRFAALVARFLLHNRLSDSADLADRATATLGWSDEDQLKIMPELVAHTYMGGEAADYYRHDEAAAQAAWDRTENLAARALALVAAHPDSEWASPAALTAHLGLGLVALRHGSREGALRAMHDAARVPPSDRLSGASDARSLEYRLLDTLLMHDERATVIDYLERLADRRADDRDRLLASAAAIRAGMMPEGYQRRRAQEAQAAARAARGPG